MPDQERPSSTYGVMVSRVEERPAADFWPIGLRQPLPTIPVPLRPANSHASLELQKLLHEVYDRGTYAQEIYEQEAEPPGLTHHNSEAGLHGKFHIPLKPRLLPYSLATFR